MNWDLHPAGLTALTDELNPNSCQCWPFCTETQVRPFRRAPVLQLRKQTLPLLLSKFFLIKAPKLEMKVIFAILKV